jgi:hypothetical protein
MMKTRKKEIKDKLLLYLYIDNDNALVIWSSITSSVRKIFGEIILIQRKSIINVSI